ncbi:hypothetical protein C8D87_104457 [Lentzea atacamensis]|uniref:Uncharacterized protein n=1 Tax=Lentzea atacamensis TaxID=531938 RepID=A0ABX9EC50_9PSEU|nr:hypothetical protein C8D87_104457 [Lentzea atacamensis]
MPIGIRARVSPAVWTPAGRDEPYRTHFASSHDKDTGGEARPARLWPRLVKTHHVPVVFSEAAFGGVWLLVRDPRDATTGPCTSPSPRTVFLSRELSRRLRAARTALSHRHRYPLPSSGLGSVSW